MATVIPKKSKKGFTLVELVVVIAILAILAAIAIPIVNNLVNAASRNAAVSDAQTIELAVKECQSFIVTKVDEVYDGATMLDGMRIPSAISESHLITMAHVISVKALDTALQKHYCNGVDYIPYWDTLKERCVFIGSVEKGGTSFYQSIQGEKITDTVGMSFGSRYVAIAIEKDGKMVANGSLKVYML